MGADPGSGPGPTPTLRGIRPVSAAHEWATTAPHLSVEFAHWAAKKIDGIEGEGSMLPAVPVGVVTDGQPEEPAWPYGKPPWPSPPPPSAVSPARLRRPASYKQVDPFTFDDVAARVEAGARVVVSMGCVLKQWRAASATGWVEPGVGPIAGRHVVLAVGTVSVVACRSAALIVENLGGLTGATPATASSPNSTGTCTANTLTN